MRKIRQKFRQLTIESKLYLLRMIAIIPMVIGISFLLILMIDFNNEYNETAENVTKASQFNFSFSEDMDYTMYRIVIGAEDFHSVEPYREIKKARKVFFELNKSAVNDESKTRTRQILKLLDNLEASIKEIEESNLTKDYVKNDERLRLNVNVFTDIIDDKASEYIYYETGNLEQLRTKLEKEIMQTVGISVGVFAFLIILITQLTKIITRSITTPINDLCHMTEQVAEGNFEVSGPQNATGEIGILVKRFDDMVQQISELIDDVKLEQINLRKKELELLQSQINPHFLYNTLDTIVWLAMDKENDKVVEMVNALSRFFRTSLSGGQDIISIEEELSHVESYLEIQGLRYGDIMDYSIDVPKYLQQNRMLKMTLQPLVENALYHGIKMQREKGSIFITAVDDEDNIYLTVEDNGIGMDSRQVEELNKAMLDPKQADQTQHFGVMNVNRRIKLHFGDEYGLILESELGVGTKVIIVVPKRDKL